MKQTAKKRFLPNKLYRAGEYIRHDIIQNGVKATYFLTVKEDVVLPYFTPVAFVFHNNKNWYTVSNIPVFLMPGDTAVLMDIGSTIVNTTDGIATHIELQQLVETSLYGGGYIVDGRYSVQIAPVRNEDIPETLYYGSSFMNSFSAILDVTNEAIIEFDVIRNVVNHAPGMPTTHSVLLTKETLDTFAVTGLIPSISGNIATYALNNTVGKYICVVTRYGNTLNINFYAD